MPRHIKNSRAAEMFAAKELLRSITREIRDELEDDNRDVLVRMEDEHPYVLELERDILDAAQRVLYRRAMRLEFPAQIN